MLLFEHFGAWGGHGDWDSWKEGWYCLWSQWLEIRPFSSPQTSATQWRLFRTSHNPESSLQIQWQHERAQDWDPEDLGLAPGSTSYQSCEFWVNFLISLGCILHVKLNTIILLPTVQDYCANRENVWMVLCELCRALQIRVVSSWSCIHSCKALTGGAALLPLTLPVFCIPEPSHFFL